MSPDRNVTPVRRDQREREIIAQILGSGMHPDHGRPADVPDPMLYAKYQHDPAFHMVVVMAARAQYRVEELERWQREDAEAAS